MAEFEHQVSTSDFSSLFGTRSVRKHELCIEFNDRSQSVVLSWDEVDNAAVVACRRSSEPGRVHVESAMHGHSITDSQDMRTHGSERTDHARLPAPNCRSGSATVPRNRRVRLGQ